jgi:preprotein translocase subunit SecA
MKGIRTTQKKVEEDNFAVRRDTLEYDDVNDMQRESIYKERRRILAKENVEDDFLQCVNRSIDASAEVFKGEELADAISELTQGAVEIKDADKMSRKVFVALLKRKVIEKVNDTDFASDEARQSYIRRCVLVAVDSAWAEHLKALEFCREAVGYVGYGQMDPKAVYAHEAYKLYEKMQKNIYASAMFSFFSNRVQSKQTLETEDGKLRLKSGKDLEV